MRNSKIYILSVIDKNSSFWAVSMIPGDLKVAGCFNLFYTKWVKLTEKDFEDNFTKEKFERAKSCHFRGCKFCETIYSNFSKERQNTKRQDEIRI